MNIEMKKILLSIIFVGIIIFGLVGTNFWFKIDLQKCNDVLKNDYYYTDNNCWETHNLPWLVQLEMFIVIIILPLILWFILIEWMVARE